MFRIAASDYLDPLFLPELVAQVKKLAPQVRLELLPLSGEFDYRRSLASGAVDLVVGNWLEPPGELHLGKLMSDEIVACRRGTPVRSSGCSPAAPRRALRATARPRLDRRAHLACEHVAPTPLHANAPGVIDEHLSTLGLTRDVMVRSAH